MKLTAFLFVCAALLCGCSSVEVQRNPKADFSKIRRYYVEHRLADNHRVSATIVEELQRRGLEASAGPLTMKPAGIDALISYQDEWGWDFKSYLTLITIEVRDARTDAMLARGASQHASPIAKDQSVMVRETFDKIFK